MQIAKREAGPLPIIKGERPKKHTRQPDTTPHKENQPHIPIAQVSFSIACLEEGRHISTMVQKLVNEPIPPTTDMLIVISDNGSRGANEIIHPENDLHIQRIQLYEQLQAAGHASEFDEIVARQVTARRLELPTTQKKEEVLAKARENNQKLQQLFENLQHTLPPDVYQDVVTYQKVEDAQRQRLALALKSPRSFIDEADRKIAPRTKNHEPTAHQLATIQTYAEILLGKYDQECNNVRIKLVTGSQTGSFGSVRKVGNMAIEEDFAQHHPDSLDTNHVVFAGFDMDSDFDAGLIAKTVERFSQNPDGMALLGNVKLTRENWLTTPFGKKGDLSRPWFWYQKYVDLIPGLARGFMDLANLKQFFDAEHRDVADFMPGGVTRQHKKGKAKDLPNLFPGPFIVVRGSVLKEVPIQEIWGQGEDILFSLTYQRKFAPESIMVDSDISYYFNMRDPYLFHIAGSVVRRSSNIREAVKPFKHRELQDQMTPEEWGEFRRGINAHMHRSTLLGATIRKIEQQQFGLSQNQYVIARAHSSAQLPNYHGSTRTEARPGYNTLTGNYDWALIATAPSDVKLEDNEYVARKLGSKEAQKVSADYEKGEKVVTVHNPFTRETEHYLVRTLLADRPLSQIDMRVAETLSTFHNGRSRRTASVPPGYPQL